MANVLERVTIETMDGLRLAGDLHLAAGAPRLLALLAPAMGVRRGFYRTFCAYLAEGGIAVLVIDYRGIGDSRPAPIRRFRAALHDWAHLDLEAALRYLPGRFPGVPQVFVGHSVGGQLFGLLREPRVERALFLASQSGYFLNWDGRARLAMAAIWHVLIPGVVGALGYLPMRALGQGEDVPGGVALEWARWGRHPDYILSYARGHGPNAFSTYAGPLRSYAIADDRYAPRRSVQALLRGYALAHAELCDLRPAALGLRGIGHFGVMRAPCREAVWAPIRKWLLGAG